MYGGETINYTFDKCNFMDIEITSNLPVVLGEWNLEPDCSEVSAGEFICTCQDDYVLLLTPKVNAVGTYNFIFDTYVEGEYPEPKYRTVYRDKIINVTSTISTTIPTTTIPEQPIREETKLYQWLFFILIGLIIFAVIVLKNKEKIIRFYYKNKLSSSSSTET